MSAKDDLSIPLIPSVYYHIFNRGINRCDIYFNQENYKYFLKKYSEKMTGYFDTFGYCLLQNHFHMFVRVVHQDQLLAKAVDDFIFVNQTFYKDYVIPWVFRMKLDVVAKEIDLTNFRNLLNLYNQHGDVQQGTSSQPLDLQQSSFIEQLCSWVVSERFRGFMLGYVKAINKQESRTGSLFQKGFRRKYVPDSEIDKKRVLFYVHHNPIHHFYTNNYGDYTWSSYNTYLTVSPTRLSRNEAMDWFESKEKFIDFGEHYKNNKFFDDKWIIDED